MNRQYLLIKKSFGIVSKCVGYIFQPICVSLFAGVLFTKYNLHITQHIRDKAIYTVDLFGKEFLRFEGEAWQNIIMVYTVISFIGIWLLFYLIVKLITDSLPGYESKKLIGVPPPFPFDQNKMQLIVGLKKDRLTLNEAEKPQWLILEEKGLYQNFLITGGIGSGKTASAMYPFVKQFLYIKPNNQELKCGMLILDVKGNFYKQVEEFAQAVGRSKDIIRIELGGENKYNPLNKPNIPPLILAGRVKKVLGLFSPNTGNDSYWLDKAEMLIAESIKLIRASNEGYVNFVEIYKIIANEGYREEIIRRLEYELDENPKFKNITSEEVETAVEYFTGEFRYLSENTLTIIQSVTTQMTQAFYSDPYVKRTFSPPKNELTFDGLSQIINEGKIVVLNMPPNQYQDVARIIAAYLKLDFQNEVLSRTSATSAYNKTRPVFFVCDEYQDFVTSNDGAFYAVSREAKCCSIVATQSYTSLKESLKRDDTVKTITQNLFNKIWFQTQDVFTFETAQKETGREDKERISRNISESSSDTKKSRILGRLVSDKSSISESINISMQKDYIFDSNVFTDVLQTFKAVVSLSDGTKRIPPTILHMLPFFESPIKNIKTKETLGNEEKTINIYKDNQEQSQAQADDIKV